MNKVLIWIIRIAFIIGLFVFLKWVMTLNGLIAFFAGLFLGALTTMILLYKYSAQSRAVLQVMEGWVEDESKR